MIEDNVTGKMKDVGTNFEMKESEGFLRKLFIFSLNFVLQVSMKV